MSRFSSDDDEETPKRARVAFGAPMTQTQRTLAAEKLATAKKLLSQAFIDLDRSDLTKALVPVDNFNGVIDFYKDALDSEGVNAPRRKALKTACAPIIKELSDYANKNAAIDNFVDETALPEPQGPSGPPTDAAQSGSSGFNSLRAMVAITRRIHDLKLLPPHSRTLNFSLLKRLLETTALYSNNQIKDFYKLYKQGDVTSDDLVNVTDAGVRQMKKDVREYVDRLLCPAVFLETEIEGNHFTSAFTASSEYLASKGVTHRTVRLLGKRDERLTPEEDTASPPRPCFEPCFDWASVTRELADVILRHADMRGNIVAEQNPPDDPPLPGPGFDKLMNPDNWYNSWQHVWGDVYDTYRTLDARIDAKEVREEDALATWKALIKPHERAGVVVGSIDGTFDTWEKVKTFMDKGWGVHSLIESAFKAYGEDSRTDEPLTAFDIALLGGLHPRTYAVELNAKAKRDAKVPDNTLGFKLDEFFELCMEYFDSNGTGAEDLGFRIFLTPLVRRSLHTSYLPFRRKAVGAAEKTNLVRFGPRKGDSQVGGDGAPAGKADAEGGRRGGGRGGGAGGGPALPTTSYTDFSFETYCDQCFERGAEMYIRLVHVMIKSHLEALRRIHPSPEVLTPFAKLIGLTIQRAQLLNPMVKFGANSTYNRDMRRNNNRATTEARVQLARACGFEPDIYLEGYALL